MSKKKKAEKKNQNSEEEFLENEIMVDQDMAEEEEELTREEELVKERDELKDKYLRLNAEFHNFKKRVVKEKLNLINTAAKDTLTALLPVLDDFDRAKKNAEDNESAEPLSEGVLLVYNKLYSSLKQKGLVPMDSTGKDFDPELHAALTEIPSPTEDMKGKVIDTIERGYFLNDIIIRHAKVVVGK